MEFPEKGTYTDEEGRKYTLTDFARDISGGEWFAVLKTGKAEPALLKRLSEWDEPPLLFSAAAKQTALREEPLPEPEDKLGVLKRYFGYDSFRGGQEAVVDALLAGRDTLAVMPTGAGKSLCYQIPALMLPGVTLVVSPLISLMKDQVQALVQSGIPAAYLNSSLTERQYTLAVNNMIAGKYKIIYVAPERLGTPRFLSAVRSVRVSMVAVDEAHCISQWGQDFRPSYLEIPSLLNELSYRPVMCAFTATATDNVRADILKLLGLRDPFVQITGFDRKNLYYQVIRPKKKDDELIRLLKSYKGFSGIVYCATRKKVEDVHQLLLEKGFSATRYHAGLSDAERLQNQEDFSYDRREIMVATNAFGMGIDKSNVRFVIHYNMPKDPESYYQEAGRAGRDGERSDCTLLYSRGDIMTQKFFIDRMGEEAQLTPEELAAVQQNARKRLDLMVRYCETTDCLRKYMLNYFGENAPDNCGFCLNCRRPAALTDVSDAARRVLECVDQTGQRFGRTVITDVLRGAETKTVQSFRLENALSYGALKHLSRDTVSAVIDRLIDMEALEVQEVEYSKGSMPILRFGYEAAAVLEGTQTVMIAQRAASASGEKDKKQELLRSIDRDLYERLRELRKKMAFTRGVPPYVVFSDAVLRELAEKRPATKEQMEEIKGIGVVKLRDYGAAFLREIQKYIKESGNK